MFRRSLTLPFLLCIPFAAFAADPTEEDYYPWTRLPLPAGEVLEAGDVEWVPNDPAQPQGPGRLYYSTRRGEIWVVDQADSADIGAAKLTRFAHGLHEVLGLAWRNDGWLYAVQRGEVTRLKDSNGDGKADVFETFNDGWEIDGDYHEYAFGAGFDRENNLWVTLCLTGSFGSNNKYRGWCLRIDPNGKTIPTCSGIRSPGGMGFSADGDCFYCDNQGPWNGACSLKHLRPGSFQGHPDSFRWYEAEKLEGKPKTPESGSRSHLEAVKIPEYEVPAVFFPYAKMGKSAAGITADTTGGKFGPFQKQLFVADQHDSTVMRVFLEKVDGKYQGVCFPFKKGGGSGCLSVEITPKGQMFVGGTNRGWGSVGNKPFALERLDWTGKVPFEIHEMRAKPDGFELTFTEPVDPATAAKLDGYKMTTYTYIYQSSYGSPEVDHTTPVIKEARVAEDGKSVRLIVDGLKEGHVHELHATGIRSGSGLPLLHQQAYYTLWWIPKS